MLKVVFVSNYYNHHQSSFSDSMNKMPDVEYHFVETSTMSSERRKMGYEITNKPDYVIASYLSDENKEECLRIIEEADFVIIGSAPDSYIAKRHKTNKFNFRYSERFYKTDRPVWTVPLHFVKNYLRFNRYKNDYLLCASAFTAGDAIKTRSFVGKAYKWGYFPPVYEHDLDSLFAQKRASNKVSILWAGRLIGWKHPDASIILAEKLKRENLPFDLKIIGGGELEKSLKKMISEKDLSDCVSMLGVLNPNQVRTYMDRSDIFLFTSDHNEGWGAVLNEAMNSGCAIVASHAIGSVPFLLNNQENGIIYHSGDNEELFEAVRQLILDQEKREVLGRAAQRSITEVWNAETAANRLIRLYQDLVTSHGSNTYSYGPCSKAPVLKDEWY